MKDSYKATVTKTIYYWQNNKHRDQWKTAETSEINTQIWSTDFLRNGKRYSIAKEKSCQQIVPELLNIHI